MKSFPFYALFIILLALAATAADDIGGHYTCFGKQPYTGRLYGCNVEIERSGDVYKIEWKYEGGYGYCGVGIVKNGYLCVGHESPINYGVAVYRIQADGTLDGVCGLPGYKETGSEKFYREEVRGEKGEPNE
jgi:hypothetical protein